MGKVVIQSNKIIVSPEPTVFPNIFMELIPLAPIYIAHPKGFLSTLKNGQLTISKNLSNNEKFILEKIDDLYHIKSHSGKYLSQIDRIILACKDTAETNEKFYLERKSTGLTQIKTYDGNYIQIQSNNNFTLSATCDTEFEIVFYSNN